MGVNVAVGVGVSVAVAVSVGVFDGVGGVQCVLVVDLCLLRRFHCSELLCERLFGIAGIGGGVVGEGLQGGEDGEVFLQDDGTNTKG